MPLEQEIKKLIEDETDETVRKVMTMLLDMAKKNIKTSAVLEAKEEKMMAQNPQSQAQQPYDITTYKNKLIDLLIDIRQQETIIETLINTSRVWESRFSLSPNIIELIKLLPVKKRFEVFRDACYEFGIKTALKINEKDIDTWVSAYQRVSANQHPDYLMADFKRCTTAISSHLKLLHKKILLCKTESGDFYALNYPIAPEAILDLLNALNTTFDKAMLTIYENGTNGLEQIFIHSSTAVPGEQSKLLTMFSNKENAKKALLHFISQPDKLNDFLHLTTKSVGDGDEEETIINDRLSLFKNLWAILGTNTISTFSKKWHYTFFAENIATIDFVRPHCTFDFVLEQIPSAIISSFDSDDILNNLFYNGHSFISIQKVCTALAKNGVLFSSFLGLKNCLYEFILNEFCDTLVVDDHLIQYYSENKTGRLATVNYILTLLKQHHVPLPEILLECQNDRKENWGNQIIPFSQHQYISIEFSLGGEQQFNTFALMLALDWVDLETIQKMVVELGTHINKVLFAQSENGYNALLIAMIFHKPDCLRLLLNAIKVTLDNSNAIREEIETLIGTAEDLNTPSSDENDDYFWDFRAGIKQFIQDKEIKTSGPLVSPENIAVLRSYIPAITHQVSTCLSTVIPVTALHDIVRDYLGEAENPYCTVVEEKPDHAARTRFFASAASSSSSSSSSSSNTSFTTVTLRLTGP